MFDAATVARMAEHFVTLLAGAVAGPDRRLSGLPLLGDAERLAILTEWSVSGAPPAEPRCVHELFAEQAARTPDAVALVSDGRSLTYAELDRRADALARRLAARGVGPDVRVGIFVERSPEMVVGLLGVLKAGGAYLVLDPEYPAERIAFMLADARVPVLLAGEALLGRLPETGAEVVLLEAVSAGSSDPPPPVAVTPEHLAYVIYTSGSTGTPKGTEVPHRAVPGFFRGADYARFDAGQVLLQHSSTSWDALTLELWPALLTGGRCVLFAGRSTDFERMEETIRREGVTTLWLSAALFDTIVDTRPGMLDGVAQVMIGGEAVSVPHVRRALEAYPGLRLVNGYGPSECTVFATCHVVDGVEGGAGLPIGRPVGDRRVHVLDARLDPVPAGVPGELFVGGPAVARGYLGRPELTAERFVPDPFSREPGARMYRSGDEARWRADGTLEFVGRADGQLKVRGFRVEPEEVEAALAAHPAVRSAAVAAREGRLVGYVAAADPQAPPSAEALRAWLAERLPEYMVPATIVPLDALPLTAHGKLDRRALPDPSPGSRAGADAPKSPVEEVLAGIWADVLGLAEVGPRDDFFALGGHSLLATRVASRVREVFRVELPLRTLFEAPTVEALARRVEAARADGSASVAPPVVPVGRGGPLPLSFAQERLWFVEQMRPGGGAYAIPVALRLSGALDAGAMERSLSEIVRRHEALRTVFPARGGRPVQVVLPPAPLPLAAESLESAPARERDGALRGRLRAESRRAFDLAEGPLFRATLFRLDAETHVLLLCMHHVVSDGWSMGVLLRELGALYPAFAAGEEPALPPLPVQYADFAVWQRERLAGEALERQLAYWREALAGAPPVLELPTDRPRPSVQGFGGAVHSFAVPAAVSAAARALGRREGATAFMTLLAAWQLLLSRHAGTDDLVVGAPVAGRTRRETEELIGFFVNAVPLRGDLGGDPTVRELLGRAREATLGAYGHQDVPFERLVEELRTERSLSHSPVFQVMFTFQDGPPAPPSLPGLRVELSTGETGAAKYDLVLALVETGDGLLGELEYATELFDAATVVRIADRYRTLVEAMAADPARRLSDLSVLEPDEREQVLRGWNSTDAPCPAWYPVHRLVARRASERPDAVAVVDGAARVTYRGLVALAEGIADALRARGVGPEDRVAVCMERGTEMLAAQLGVMMAGGAFVPLDPAYPAGRIAFVLADSGARVLLTRERLRGALPEVDGVEVVTPHPPAPSPLAGERENCTEADPDSLAYVIYTSGSTGTPKGVGVTHRGLANLVGWHRRAFGVTAAERATQLAGAGFDASVWEAWPYLAAGAELHVVEDEVRAVPAALRDRLVERGITVAFLPTPLAEAVLALEWPAEAALRVMLTGGDALHVRPAAGLPFELVNAYGPTENAVVATAGPVAPGGAEGRLPSIGGPIANVRTYVLGAGMQPVPPGAPGELFLGGDGVARGYHGRPALTAERFVPDPFSGAPGARLYRTGDRARWLSDGTLEFLGRLDRQVKLRGFRVETGEVEWVLAGHPAVREAAVELRGEGAARRLVGWVVGSADPAELRAHLRGRLPEYMVPSTFVRLEALPMTPNGKVDREALPEPEDASEAEGAAPRSELEAAIVAVWREALKVERVGVHDSFFDLGGHSLLLAQVHARLREELGRELSIVDLFRFPTVAALAAHLEPEREPEAEEGGRTGSERAAARRAMQRRRGGRGGA